LGYDRCDAAIVTNIAADHLGLEGIHTLEQLARVKSVVPESVCKSGYAILNADDDLVYAMKDAVPCQVALFSLYAESARIEAHCAAGGMAAYLENGYLMLRIGNELQVIEEAAQIPLTFGGHADFNIANILAAVLAAYTNGIRLSTIRQALRNFMPSAETTPGRMNVFEFCDFRVILDYAHNPHGVRAIGKLIARMDARHRVGIITAVGDRRDEDIRELGAEAARIFDEIIIRHDEDMRGRKVEEVENLLMDGIRRVRPGMQVKLNMAECEAIDYAVLHAKEGSLIVALTEDIKAVAACLEGHQQRERLQKAG
jgi:cyanophycin synthetase